MSADHDAELVKFESFFEKSYLNIPEHLLTSYNKLVYTKGVDQRYSPEFTGGYALLRSVFMDLKRSLLNIVTDENHVHSRKYGYCYPNSSDVDFFRETSPTLCSTNNSCGKSQLANSSKEDVEGWLESFISQFEGHPGHDRNNQRLDSTLRVVTGKVGSGKSTLIRFLEAGFRDVFEEGRVFFCVINYKDIASAIAEVHPMSGDGIQWDRVLEKLITWRFMKGISSNPNVQALFNDGFEEYYLRERTWALQKEASIDMGDDQIERMVKRELAWVMGVVERGSRLTFRKSFDTNDEILRYVFGFIREKGYSLLATVDGLDQVSIGGITEGKFSGIFNALMEKTHQPFLFNDQGLCLKFLLTFRACTWSTFSSAAFLGPKLTAPTLVLVPVHVFRIITNAVNALEVLDTTIEYTPERIRLINKYIKLLTKKASKALGLTTQEFSLLFNNNVRKLINFLLEMNLYYTNRVIGNAPSHDLDGFLKHMVQMISQEEPFKVYEVVETLLLRSKTRFVPYYDRATFDFDRIIERNSSRGFVDNLLNYTENFNAGTTPPLLVKIRILQYLKKQGVYCRKRDIVQSLKRIGYMAHFDNILFVLLGAGFIKIRSDGYDGNTGTYIYNITGLGTYALENFCRQVTYLEHIVQHTLLPKVIVEDLHAMALGDVTEWVEGSMGNLFILYQYIAFVELLEKRVCKALDIEKMFGTEWGLSPQIKDSIIASKHRFVSSAGHVFNVNNVNSRIEKIIGKWQREGIYVG